MAKGKEGTFYEHKDEIFAKLANISTDGDSITADVTGDLTGNVTGNVTGGVYSIGTSEFNYIVAGALELNGQALGSNRTYTTATPAIATAYSTVFLDATSNGVAATLADGAEGNTIVVKCIDATNAVTLVPANLLDGTTITFDVNEYITLYFDGTNWCVIGGNAAIT